MIAFEPIARPLLVLHGVAASVLVASTTHHLIWCRGYLRGSFARQRGERRFAAIAAIAYVTTFALGNLLYPTYKVRVRAEYLDSPVAVAQEIALRAEAAARVGSGAPALARGGTDLTWVARLFDVKEHWVALGCAAAIGLFILSRRAHPSADRRVLPAYLGLSVLACATAWAGAIAGLVTTSFRAVGGSP